jgi:LmbE family N-acetylglucosaminyl deacetylase
MRVLAVAAHPDDEVIGPGATLALHARSGDEVAVLIMADGKTSRPNGDRLGLEDESQAETAAAAAVLGISAWQRLQFADNQLDTYPLLELAQRIGDVVTDFQPDVVYTHHIGDLNVDHELTARAALIASRPHVSSVRWLLSFPTLSATDAGYASREPFVASIYVDVTETMGAKLAAMRCYASEVRDRPHPRSLEVLEAHAVLAGSFANMALAEVFSVVRGCLPGLTPFGR